jgi:hypothetical protein
MECGMSIVKRGCLDYGSEFFSGNRCFFETPPHRSGLEGCAARCRCHHLKRLTIHQPMKTPSLLLKVAAVLALCLGQAQAVILPPTDDTSGTLTYSGKPPVVTKRSLTSANGASGSLPVSKTRTAFIRFEVEGAGITPASLNLARLTLYFPNVTKAGDLSLHVVTEDWDENFTEKTRLHPAFSAPFLTIPADSVGAPFFRKVHRAVKHHPRNRA